MKKSSSIGLYGLLIPGMIVIFIFSYIPMYGVIIAFQDFNIFQGIAGSQWVGLRHFERLLYSDNFIRVLKNTLVISVYKIIIGFPIPIIIALLLNEIRRVYIKRIIQTTIYLPHFLSWVIVYGLFMSLFSSSGGFMRLLFGSADNAPVIFTDNRFFRGLLILSEVWKEAGWGTVLYIASITSVDPMIYESAIIDGAGRFRRMWNITIPGIAPTIIMVLILRIGGLMNSHTEQVLLFLNPLVFDTGDVIGTYVYRMGLGKMEYSFSTAVGLFNSVINFLLMITANRLSREWAGRSIW